MLDVKFVTKKCWELMGKHSTIIEHTYKVSKEVVVMEDEDLNCTYSCYVW